MKKENINGEDIREEDIFFVEEGDIFEDETKKAGPKYSEDLPSFEKADGDDVSGASDRSIARNDRIGEIFDLRERACKVYRLKDGGEQAVFYPSAVHVFDEETKSFDDVDNTLVSEEDGKHFVTSKNNFVAKFNREDDNNELFSIRSGIHGVTVSSKKHKKKNGRGFLPKALRKSVDGIERFDTLVFGDIEDGSDYEYSVTGSGIKENIIIKEKSDVYRYSFIIHPENVIAELDDKNRYISFTSSETGEEIFFIPSPFMTDQNGAFSSSLYYELKEASCGDVVLNIVADSEWINHQDRAFPVVIDPQIQLSGASSMTTYSWNGGIMYNASQHTIGAIGHGDGACGARRMYIGFNMPNLPRNPRIKKAELKFYKAEADMGAPMALGLYRVNTPIHQGAQTPLHDTELIDFAMSASTNGDGTIEDSYTFDITDMVDQINKGESTSQALVLKMIDEAKGYNQTVTLYGSTSGTEHAPQLVFTYESSYGISSAYRTHTHALGRFGSGSIDLQCGNLMFESEDFSWSGNRMPVTLKHLYNSALANYQYTKNSGIKLNVADLSAMKIGYGFKMNVMQSMIPCEVQHEGEVLAGYVYTDENGNEIYFKKSAKQVRCDSSSQCYDLYEDINDFNMLYDPIKLTLKRDDETYLFDDHGRLIKITDAYGNHMDIVYTSGRITSVIDGAGREFSFSYNGSGFLQSITAPDDSNVVYTYSGDLLSAVTYHDGRKASLSYSSNKPVAVTLFDPDGNCIYKVAYEYAGDHTVSVTEYGVENGELVAGARSEYDYSAASCRTIVKTIEQNDTDDADLSDNIIRTVYTFDEDGNVISEYAYFEDTGNIGITGEESGIHPYSGDGGACIVSNINNLLSGHNFETLDNWTSMVENDSKFNISSYAYEPYTKYGKKLLRMQSSASDIIENGVYQETEVLAAGRYSFSVYLRVSSAFSGGEAPGVFIRVVDAEGNVVGISERLALREGDYTRLIAPFELLSEKRVKAQILVNGKGTVYADAAQLENNPYANAYNMLENGNFERGKKEWTCSSGVEDSSDTCFNMKHSLMMVGDIDKNRAAYQNVTVRSNRSTRETFTLSGWAKGYGLPAHDRSGAQLPTFRLRAVVKYYDSTYKEYGTEEFTADFSPCTEEWQLASVQFAKSKYRSVQNIRVYCEYGYNSGVAYFDDIQLVRNDIETYLSASDFVVESTGASDDEEEEEEIETAPSFKEAKDEFGNTLTETTFTDGEFGTIYRSFGFNADNGQLIGDDTGNNLVVEKDARGNVTRYTVDSDTSRNEEIIDRLGSKTSYEYDDAGRTTKVTSKKADGTEIANVSYSYDGFDNMTEIARGDGMKYALKYNQFHNLESIGIDGKDDDLVKYTYKNGNGRLKQITYANGDIMKATYNSIGQMIAEKWFDKGNTLTAHYKYVYDGQSNIVCSIDILKNKEYNYEYEEGRIVRATEADVAFTGEIVTSKTFVNTVKYYYDTDGKLTKKTIAPAADIAQTIYYENGDDNTVVKFNAGGKTITAHSKNDTFGRKVFDEIQLETGFVSRQFSYHAGEVTDEHKDNAKLKSSATTQLVSQIVLSGGRTISYEYDAEERITKVADSVDGTTEYTYDTLGQLLSETVNGVVKNSMVYDNYGNIKSKNGVEYTYGDGSWKDLLTKVGDQTITYDKQGNPTNYLGHTLTWEKGRQLKSFDNIQYTYNANGIRTSKTVNGIEHTYTLDGTKILREVWGNNTLVPIYDNEESVCGIIYNSEPFYFQKNLQGDIISIVNKDSEIVAKYSYDAWGTCTIIQDVSECGIANVNPYRYRGYYFDSETSLYYLQSRYYDADIGRFLCVDTPEVIAYISEAKATNLFAYCSNNPINETDRSGLLLASKLAEIFLSAVFGMVAQLFDDLVIYFLQVLVHNKKKAIFDPNPSDYVSRALSWALECVNPFSGKKKWLNVIFAVVPLVVKTIWDLIAGKGFDLWSFLRNIFYSLAGVIIANVLGRRAKNEIAKIKRHYRGKKPVFKAKTLQINAKYKVLGNRITTKIDIASVVVETVLAIIFM